VDLGKPTVVVLEGGGAKGAYSAAVMSVLKTKCKNLTAGSGASAGALNVVALGVDRIEDAQKAWENLTLWQLIGPHGSTSQSISIKIGRTIFAIALLFLNVSSARFSNRHDYFRRQGSSLIIPTIIFAAIVISLSIAISGAIFALNEYKIVIIGGSVSGLIALAALYNGPRIITGTIISGIMFNPPLIFVMLLLTASEFSAESSYYALLGAGSFAVSTALSISIGWAAASFPSQYVALLGTDHLRATLQTFLSHPWRRDCYASMSFHARTVDEASPIVHDPQPAAAPDPNGGLNLNVHYEYVPIYRNLRQLPRSVVVRTLTASAALPLGIIKQENFGRLPFEDGGLSDNCPIVPMLMRPGDEQMLIVLLTPVTHHGKPVDLATQEGQDVAREKVIAQMEVTTASRRRRVAYRTFARNFRLRSGSDIIPLEGGRGLHGRSEMTRYMGDLLSRSRSPDYTALLSRRSIIVIAPEKNLGGLFTGTLAFFPSRIREFSGYGREDATRILEALSKVATHA